MSNIPATNMKPHQKTTKTNSLFQNAQPLAVQHLQYSNLTSGSRDSIKPHTQSLHNTRQTSSSVQRNNYTNQHQTHTGATNGFSTSVLDQQQHSQRGKSKDSEKTAKRSQGGRHRVVMNQPPPSLPARPTETSRASRQKSNGDLKQGHNTSVTVGANQSALFEQRTHDEINPYNVDSFTRSQMTANQVLRKTGGPGNIHQHSNSLTSLQNNNSMMHNSSTQSIPGQSRGQKKNQKSGLNAASKHQRGKSSMMLHQSTSNSSFFLGIQPSQGTSIGSSVDNSILVNNSINISNSLDQNNTIQQMPTSQLLERNQPEPQVSFYQNSNMQPIVNGATRLQPPKKATRKSMTNTRSQPQILTTGVVDQPKGQSKSALKQMMMVQYPQKGHTYGQQQHQKSTDDSGNKEYNHPMYAIGINAAANSRANAVTVNKTHLVEQQGYFTQKPNKTAKHTRTSSSAVTDDSNQRNKYPQYNTVGNSQDLDNRGKSSLPQPQGKFVQGHSRDAAHQQQNSSHQRGKTEFDLKKNIEQILTLQQHQVQQYPQKPVTSNMSQPPNNRNAQLINQSLTSGTGRPKQRDQSSDGILQSQTQNQRSIDSSQTRGHYK